MSVADSFVLSVGTRIALGLNFWILTFFPFFIPSSEILLFVFVSGYDKENSLFTGLSSLESGPVTELIITLGRSSTPVTLLWSCVFPASFAHAVLSASSALPSLANLTESTQMDLVQPSLPL